MNKRLKGLIERAEVYNQELLDDLFIIPSGKVYNGFWGKNGYNKIILIGRNLKEAKAYRIDTDIQHDIIHFSYIKEFGIKIDIPTEYNCVRLFCSSKYLIVDNNASALSIYSEERLDEKR